MCSAAASCRRNKLSILATYAEPPEFVSTELLPRNLSDPCSVYEGHADAITAIAFSPDSRYLVTACSEGAWRLFDTRKTESSEALLVCDVGHDLGVQGCDFSPTTGPFTMTGMNINQELSRNI